MKPNSNNSKGNLKYIKNLGKYMYKYIVEVLYGVGFKLRGE